MARFVTTLASLSLMVLAFIVSVQAADPGAPIGVGGEDSSDYGSADADFF